MRTLRNILIIKPGAIGDVLQMTPVVRALKKKEPQARITVLVGSAATAGLFGNNPHVSDTLVYDKRGEHRTVASFAALWRTVRAGRYDLVLNFQRSNLKTWLLAAAAFPCRVLVYHKSDRLHYHAVENYLDTLAPLGIPRDGLELELFPGPGDRAFADAALGGTIPASGPLIALNPGASHAVNRWSAEQFAALADLLSDRLGARILIIGGTEDAPLAARIASGMKKEPLVMTGRASLLQLGALLERASLLVTGDTGPMHVATAVGTRVLALFGAADPERTGPVGRGHRVLRAENVPCVPCRKRTCSNNEYLACMRRIAPERVFQAIVEMLQEPCEV